MIDLRLNSKRLAAHWHYYGSRYFLFLVLAIGVSYFLFTVTTPRAPYEKRVDVIILSGASNSDAAPNWEAAIKAQLPPDQQEVTVQFTALMEGQGDMLMQVLTAKMAAGEGTVWILPTDYFQALAAGGAFMDLSGMVGDLGVPEGTNLTLGKAMVGKDESNPGTEELVGIPLDKCKGLNKLLTTNGMVLALPIFAEKNLDNAKHTAKMLLTNVDGVAPAPTK